MADREGSLAHRGGDTLDRPSPDVADGEEPRHARLKVEWPAVQWPDVLKQLGGQVVAGEEQAVLVADELRPFGPLAVSGPTEKRTRVPPGSRHRLPPSFAPRSPRLCDRRRAA